MTLGSDSITEYGYETGFSIETTDGQYIAIRSVVTPNVEHVLLCRGARYTDAVGATTETL